MSTSYETSSHSQPFSQEENRQGSENGGPDDGGENSCDWPENLTLNIVAHKFAAQGEWKEVADDLEWRESTKYN